MQKANWKLNLCRKEESGDSGDVYESGGTFVPPLIIFPRKRMKNELMDRATPGSIFDCQKSGWIQMDMFTKWFKHFVSITKPSQDDPVLLLLDGHYSHSRNLDVIVHARENHVVIVCLPPHSSHKLQPLDVAFMHPLKMRYGQEIRTWLANHRDPVRPVTHYQVSELRKSLCKICYSGNRYEWLPKNWHLPI